jgi:hypothetical protein
LFAVGINLLNAYQIFFPIFEKMAVMVQVLDAYFEAALPDRIQILCGHFITKLGHD